MPVLHVVLTEMPTKKDGLVCFGMRGGEIDQAAVEVFHLDAQRLELFDGRSHVAGRVLELVLQLPHTLRVEAASVSRDAAVDKLEPTPYMEKPLAGVDKTLNERSNDGERRVCLVLSEEPHVGMLNSAFA